MASIQDVIDSVNALNTELTEIVQAKLDVIQQIVADLKAGAVPQAKIDELAAAVAGAKAAADSLSADEDSTINNP